MDRDVMMMSAEDFSALEDFQLQEVLQQIIGHESVELARMRRLSSAHYEYMSAKEQLMYMKAMASQVQTLLRSKV